MKNTNIVVMDAFDKTEMEGRAKALKVLNGIIFDDEDNYSIIPTDKFCQWDFEVRHNVTHKLIAVIEVKDRRMDSTDSRIVYEGIHLDTYKVRKITQYAKCRHADAYYLATFTDNHAIMWDIINAPTSYKTAMSNKTTAVKSEKVQKDFNLFQVKDNCFEADF